MKAPAVYILASQRNGTLYIGVTSNLVQRVWQHRAGVVEGFTQQHAVKTMVWYEQHHTMESAITREKTLKKWRRDWKMLLIEERNPEWNDLWFEITAHTPAPNLVIPANLPQPAPSLVIPANAGIQGRYESAGSAKEDFNRTRNSQLKALDSRVRGNDELVTRGNDGKTGGGV